MDTGTRLGPASLLGGAMHRPRYFLACKLKMSMFFFVTRVTYVNVFGETTRYEKYLLWSSTFSIVEKGLITRLFPGNR